jgi:hypothetical protein
MLRTIAVLTRGERIDHRALRTARDGIRKIVGRRTATSESAKAETAPVR